MSNGSSPACSKMLTVFTGRVTATEPCTGGLSEYLHLIIKTILQARGRVTLHLSSDRQGTQGRESRRVCPGSPKQWKVELGPGWGLTDQGPGLAVGQGRSGSA